MHACTVAQARSSAPRNPCAIPSGPTPGLMHAFPLACRVTGKRRYSALGYFPFSRMCRCTALLITFHFARAAIRSSGVCSPRRASRNSLW